MAAPQAQQEFGHLRNYLQIREQQQQNSQQQLFKEIIGNPGIPQRIQYIAIIGENLSGRKYLLENLIPKTFGKFFNKGASSFGLIENTLYEVINLGHNLLNKQDPFEAASIIIYIFREFRSEILKKFERKAIENDKIFIAINNSSITEHQVNNEKKNFGETVNLSYKSEITNDNENNTQYIYAKKLNFGNKHMMSFNFFLLNGNNNYNTNVFRLINEIIMNNPKLIPFEFPKCDETDGTNIALIDTVVKDDDDDKIIEPEYNIIKNIGSVTIEVKISGNVSNITSEVTTDKKDKKLISILIEGQRNFKFQKNGTLLGSKLKLKEGKFRIHIKQPYNMIPIIDTVPEFKKDEIGIISFKYKTLIN